jgi:hypothetical protein
MRSAILATSTSSPLDEDEMTSSMGTGSASFHATLRNGSSSMVVERDGLVLLAILATSALVLLPRDAEERPLVHSPHCGALRSRLWTIRWPFLWLLGAIYCQSWSIYDRTSILFGASKWLE